MVHINPTHAIRKEAPGDHQYVAQLGGILHDDPLFKINRTTMKTTKFDPFMNIDLIVKNWKEVLETKFIPLLANITVVRVPYVNRPDNMMIKVQMVDNNDESKGLHLEFELHQSSDPKIMDPLFYDSTLKLIYDAFERGFVRMGIDALIK